MEIRKNKDGTERFRAKVYLQNGKSITRTFGRKTDAKSWQVKKKLEAEKNSILGINDLKVDIKFSELFDLWFEAAIKPAKSSKTIADYKSIGNCHLNKIFGNLSVRMFDRSHGDKLVKSLKDLGLENKTVNKITVVFKQILSFAEVHGYIHRNPMYRYPALKENKGRIDYLKKEEILILLEKNFENPIYPILSIALNTGMRLGEILGLTVSKINMTEGVIEVSQSLSRNGLKSTKTNLIRYIPMNSSVRSVLEELFNNFNKSDFLFLTERGRPYNPDHFCSRYYKKALSKAGARSIDFHTLRHTYASQFMMSGGSIYDLQKILGHRDIKMTEKYAHLSLDHLRSATSIVNFGVSSPNSAPREEEQPQLKLM